MFSSQGQSELILLQKVQEYCYDNIHFMKAFQKIVVLFYKGNLPTRHSTTAFPCFVAALQKAEPGGQAEGDMVLTLIFQVPVGQPYYVQGGKVQTPYMPVLLAGTSQKTVRTWLVFGEQWGRGMKKM